MYDALAMGFRLVLFTGFLLSQACNSSTAQQEMYIVEAPAGNRFCTIQEAGETIIPNGRIIRAAGSQYTVAPHPYGLTLSPDGGMAVTANSGVNPFSISLIKGLNGGEVTVEQIPDSPFTEEGVLNAVFMGLAVSADNTHLYASGGVDNKVYIFNTDTREKVDSVDCSLPYQGKDYSHGYLGDLVLSHDEKHLYVVDQINFCLNIIDLELRKTIHRVPVGRYPFGVCLSPGGKKAYVANVGMYEYSLLDGIHMGNYQEAGLGRPAYAYLSEISRKGYQVNDSIGVPPLGDPNDEAAFSVWAIDLEDPVRISAKIKTGYLVGEPIEGIPAVGGSSPNSLVCNDKYLFVSNGNNDIVSVIDLETDEVVHEIALELDPGFRSLRGLIPFGLAISPDNTRLFVAESGINAVAVIDAYTFKVLGHIPTGWFPSKLQVTPDGKRLVVANAKGYGSGPNGGSEFREGPEGWYIGNLMRGTVSVIDIPGEEKLASYTREVLANNFRLLPYRKSSSPQPVPRFPGERESPIKYIVFISKENRTYDEVFGQLEGGRGDPSLARYGRQASFSNQNGTDSLHGADIMVNHLSLAERFSVSDNFYVDSDVSADGHRWLNCTYPNEWTETSVSASYGGKRGIRLNSSAPGNFAFVGASGAIYPEDYNEAGSMWEHMERNGISTYNFGFSLELAGAYADSTMKYGGVRYLVNYPVPAPVHARSSVKYPTYNMAIPDQFRADVFMEEYTERWLKNSSAPPQFIALMLPNDHGAEDRPHAGYPYRESYMCDNDLALGRIIEFLSRTPYWKNMAVFVTEDDAQNGRDHVDAHRSLLMVISPYARRNHVSHVHTSFGSIFKTFWNILGIPYLNQYDAGATDLSDMFTGKADLRPYLAVPVDKRVFNPQHALDPFDEHFDWEAVSNSPKLDNPADMTD
jgi:YVTN family beta-propeller protein